ncbi:gamma-glutamyl-gamma-aminobutyrate hydrolase family protein ['Paenibacillus yunnanensis' Narsing Rao et al. 2020]|uniref:gamma-glutamyl-gamma-aminobutyrate hydrolase family protein n=1 Tax=Paenibacillus tengchongensis TaxID=2608684 RepID=UPI00124E883A|nr:gamma-glutamyl-gamma-aminobutyrate hydrolase family protein [Paenibacillus tengchongensis]
MSTKPVIGITPLVDEARDSYWMLPGYMEGITAAGGIPVMLPLVHDAEDLPVLLGKLDGLLFAGGHDVSPALYQEPVSDLCGAVCHERDLLERRLFQLALAADMPLFGICRGIQLFNALLGGKLVQDLPAETPGGLPHQQKPPYDIPFHAVTIAESSPLYPIAGSARLQVNSYHHQAVRIKAPALEVSATADDGIIEGLYMPGKRFVQAVQWHPEFSFRSDPASLRLFQAFVAACSEYHSNHINVSEATLH